MRLYIFAINIKKIFGKATQYNENICININDNNKKNSVSQILMRNSLSKIFINDSNIISFIYALWITNLLFFSTLKLKHKNTFNESWRNGNGRI